MGCRTTVVTAPAKKPAMDSSTDDPSPKNPRLPWRVVSGGGGGPAAGLGEVAAVPVPWSSIVVCISNKFAT
jgi:hypothetical protein